MNLTGMVETSFQGESRRNSVTRSASPARRSACPAASDAIAASSARAFGMLHRHQSVMTWPVRTD